MALKKKTISKSNVPQKTEDVLHINDVLKQKITEAPDVAVGHQLTYLPIKEVVASSSVSTHGALAVLDNSPDTFWQPSDQVAGAHLELITPNPYTCYGVDIKFKESEGKKFNLKVDVLDRQNNRWLTMAVSESSLIDDNKYERFQAAQHFKTDTFRIIINSVFDTATGNIYTQPKITQVRFFGLVPDADVIKYKVIKDQECPEGYGKDAESGQCVKTIPSQIITPKTVDAHSATEMGDKEPAGNDPENLLTVNPNDKLTLKGNGSYVEYSLDRKDVVHAVYIHKLNNPPREYTVLAAFYNGIEKQPFYHFIVDIPASQDKYIHLLNTPVRADRFVLSVTENNEPSQWFSLFGLYLIGEQGVPEEKEEPPIPKSCSIKEGGWGSKFDDKPETWKAEAMTDADKKGKYKGVGPDGKNVFHLCDSKEDAEAFIKRKIWESKQIVTPPVKPPVKPPVTGGSETPYKSTGKEVEMTQRGPTKRNYRSGKPSDWTIEKRAEKIPFDNIQAVFTVQVPEAKDWAHDDTLSIKLGGTHMGTGWFANGISVYEGKTGLGKEEKHPKTNSNIIKGKTYGDLRGKTVSIASTYFKKENKTEFWVKVPGADGTPETTGWDKACEGVNVGGFNPKAKESEVQLRIDGFKEKDSPPNIVKFTVTEIDVTGVNIKATPAAAAAASPATATADIVTSFCGDEEPVTSHQKKPAAAQAAAPAKK